MYDSKFSRNLFGARGWRARHMQAVFTLALIAAAAIGSSAARGVAAEDDDPAVTGAARALAVEGFKLAQSDQCGEAIDKLERADKLHHAAMVSARLGECYIKTGRLVEGVERLRNVLREPLPSNPSDALQQAYATSKTLLEANRPKLAALNVTVDVAPGAELDVTIDGHSIPTALLGAARPTDPGEHVIKATAPGYLAATRRLTLGPGEEASAVLAMVIDASAPRPVAKPAAGSGTRSSVVAAHGSVASSETHRGKPYLLPSLIVWGVSVAALGVGVGFGISAMNNKADLSAMCPHNACTSSQNQLLKTARSNATVSTIGYLSALGGAAIGTALYFIVGDKQDKAPETSANKAASVSAHVGLANADLSVTF